MSIRRAPERFLPSRMAVVTCPARRSLQATCSHSTRTREFSVPQIVHSPQTQLLDAASDVKQFQLDFIAIRYDRSDTGGQEQFLHTEGNGTEITTISQQLKLYKKHSDRSGGLVDAIECCLVEGVPA